jgi:hypothetical protein
MIRKKSYIDHKTHIVLNLAYLFISPVTFEIIKQNVFLRCVLQYFENWHDFDEV